MGIVGEFMKSLEEYPSRQANMDFDIDAMMGDAQTAASCQSHTLSSFTWNSDVNATLPSGPSAGSPRAPDIVISTGRNCRTTSALVSTTP